MKNKEIEFICSNCKGKLFELESEFQCTNCGNIYSVNNKIIDFRCKRQDYYFNPVSSTQMDVLTEKIRPDTWPDVIQEFIKLVGPKLPDSWIDNLVVDGRYAWKFFLDLDKEKKLLDIGCGLGNLVSNLAPYVGITYAMDLTYKRLAFTKKRMSVFNASDDIVFIAGGDHQYLPFPDHSIDCVTLSGVLEWIGEGDLSLYTEGSKPKRLWNMLTSLFGKKNPRNIQLAFLKEIKRILKTDGQLFVGIENRLSHEYFTGRPDHHSNLKYGSLMPRFLANLYSIIINKKPYRTYTYSIPGYKKLFKDAGFESTEFIGFIDGYSFLKEMLPAEVNIQNWQQDKKKNIKHKIYSHKYFVPAYGIIASSNNIRKRLQDKLFDVIRVKIGGNSNNASLIIRSYTITGKEKLIIRARFNSNKIVIKLPLNQASLESQEKNKILLEKMEGSPLCPKFLCQVNIDELKGFVEEEIEGEYITSLIQTKTPSESLYKNVAELFAKINPKNNLSPKIEFSGLFYERIVERPLNLLFSVLKDKELNKQLHAFFKKQFKNQFLMPGIYHGDVSVSNILVDSNNVYRLIDWEAGMIDGLPILDSINFVCSFYRYNNQKECMSDTIDKLTSEYFRKSEDWHFLEKQYDYFEIDPNLHESLVYLNWLQNITHLLPFTLKYNRKNIEKFIYDVAKKI